MISRLPAAVAVRRAGLLVGLIAVSLPNRSQAQGPSWSYAQYSEVWSEVRPGARGWAAELSVPLTETIFLRARGGEVEGEVNSPPNDVQMETYEGGDAGLGIHSVVGKAHAFGVLSYAWRTERTSVGPQYRREVDSAMLALGARWLISPYVSLEPEGGIASLGGFDAFGRVRLGIRLAPHVWLLGGVTSGLLYNDYDWSLGVRLAYSDSTLPPRRAPGARVVTSTERRAEAPDAALAVGQTLVAVRELRLQVRPLFGAPETVRLPKGGSMMLQKTTRNDFGSWWYVSVGTEEGWIRESELK